MSVDRSDELNEMIFEYADRAIQEVKAKGLGGSDAVFMLIAAARLLCETVNERSSTTVGDTVFDSALRCVRENLRRQTND